MIRQLQKQLDPEFINLEVKTGYNDDDCLLECDYRAAVGHDEDVHLVIRVEERTL